MDVLMTVEMIDRDPRRTDAPDLLVELTTNFRHRHAAAQPSRQQLLQVWLERAVCPNEAGRGGSSDQRAMLRQHEMHADGEARPQSRELDGVLELRSRRHDRGRGHDA